jgi:hypothetical protein
VDRGHVLPDLTVIAGGLTIHGSPAPREEYRLALRRDIARRAWFDLPIKQQNAILKQSNSDQASAWIAAGVWDRADEVLAPLRAADADDETPMLTMLKVEAWPLAGGDGLALPGIRVPLAAVTAWWLRGSGSRLEAPKDRGVVLGGALPIG